MGYMNPMENKKLMTYGILKRGLELDLTNYDAEFLGECYIEGASLFGIGPIGGGKFRGVGLRLTRDKEIAYGELWDIPDELWDWLDGIEQNGRVYTRKIVPVCLWDEQEAVDKVVDAWVYEHCFKDFRYTDKIEGGRF
jgi:gamma-glutamylcyclotransferase (GGCT)/AIG2-like uncharacterized protein YtfP